jgi:hypothetical protein
MTLTRSQLLLASLLGAAVPAWAAGEGVQITPAPGKFRVEINGHLFTEYHFEGARRPYFYPIIGPTGDGMTRNWPMKEGVPGEETDHVHHKGLWYGHRHVNGVGFWEDSAKAGTRIGKIIQDKVLEARGGREAGVIRTSNKWVADDNGELICTDERTIRIHNTPEGRMLDFDITIRAAQNEVIFGDDKDGTMAIRITETMRLKRPREKGQKTAPPGDGHIVMDTGVRDADAWGKRAAWCDYYGPVNGKTVGVAIFDHPSNPRHPTWWHVRDYGLFCANPFGQAQFEKLPDKKAGDFKIPAGQSVTFRYRFYWHEGDEKQGKVAERYRQYIGAKGSQASAN